MNEPTRSPHFLFIHLIKSKNRESSETTISALPFIDKNGRFMTSIILCDCFL